MSEAKLVDDTPQPRTRETLVRDLKHLGLTSRMTVIVHSSLSTIGWVCGGPVAVIQAIMDVITSEGTIVMPAHSGDLSDPSGWQNPPVPESWWSIIQEAMPAYDPRITPTRGMGRIVEVFRTWPRVKRSSHPTLSFAAWGANASQIIMNHELDYSMGETSPLARIYDLDGWVLLLGVDYTHNTSFHLAEYRMPGANIVEQGAPIIESKQRVWKVYQDIELDTSPFEELGAAFELRTQVHKGKVGSAQARLFPQRQAVDFAVEWLTIHHDEGM